MLAFVGLRPSSRPAVGAQARRHAPQKARRHRANGRTGCRFWLPKSPNF